MCFLFLSFIFIISMISHLLSTISSNCYQGVTINLHTVSLQSHAPHLTLLGKQIISYTVAMCGPQADSVRRRNKAFPQEGAAWAIVEHTCNTSFDSSKDFMLIFQFSAVIHKISVIGGRLPCHHQLLVVVGGFLWYLGKGIFWDSHMRMRYCRKRYFCGMIPLSFQGPISLCPAKEEV